MGDDHHELVMPFVLVQSRGGPYDDQAFVAGFELGRLYEILHLQPTGVITSVRVATLAQCDLIAMRYGYILHIDDCEGEWAQVRFTREVASPI